MAAYPHNVIISGKTPWPWATRQVRVEDDMYLSVARPFGLYWSRRIAKSSSGQVIFLLKKRSPFSPDYVFDELGQPTVSVRFLQAGHWICESADDSLEVYRLGGSKSIVSRNGCQIAIMSLQPGISLFNDHPIRLRVNEEQYLHLSIAMALLLDDFSLRLNTSIFLQSEVSTLQAG